VTATEEIQTTIGAVADQQGSAVVGIERRSGRGSGVVIAQGEVITLASNLRGREAKIAFADGRSAEGTVRGFDGELDLALIAVDTADVTPLVFSERQPAIGTAVIALANPGGQGLRATPGYVAAIDRRFRGPRGRLVTGALEHTAPLPRGSGGGPLVDLDGAVLGLNAVRVQGGLIVALPAAALAERVARLRSGEAREPRRLGVAIVPPRVARRLQRAVGLPERDGLLVRGVVADSPAAHAGLKQGDLIVAVAGQPIDGVDAFYSALDQVAAAGTLALRVVRGVEELELSATLGGV
jgi:serine protease Do